MISDKPYFSEKSKVRYVFVEGVMFKYDPKVTPKTESASNNITGTWSVTMDTPEGKTEDKVSFKKDGNNYSGSITGPRFQQAVNLERVEVNGNKLKYSYTTQAEGQSLKVDIEVTIDGESFKGTATAGSTGAFAVEGKKDPIK